MHLSICRWCIYNARARSLSTCHLPKQFREAGPPSVVGCIPLGSTPVNSHTNVTGITKVTRRCFSHLGSETQTAPDHRRQSERPLRRPPLFNSQERVVGSATSFWSFKETRLLVRCDPLDTFHFLYQEIFSLLFFFLNLHFLVDEVRVFFYVHM